MIELILSIIESCLQIGIHSHVAVLTREREDILKEIDRNSKEMRETEKRITELEKR